MCTHQRFVFNRYTHQDFLVKCGKCPACLQEKAYKRSYRIMCETSPDKIGLFVTLTYDRSSCPFVLKSDLDKKPDMLNIYREHTTRRVRVHTKSGIQYLDRRKYNTVVLDQVFNPDYDSLSSRKAIRGLAYRWDKVGVCYYPDLQLFKKRLAINLKRLYNFNEPIKSYACAEYGSRSQRPHFHLIMFIRPSDEAILRSAIPQAWPFASKRRTQKGIEVARNVANYLASYVNSGTSIHRFLSTNFKCKHSYSKDFGMSDKLFSLDSVLEKVHKRDMSYLRSVGPKGRESYISVPLPKYVINRYFPLFKGYSRFADSQVLDVLRSFIKPGSRSPSTPLINLSDLQAIQYTHDDLHRIVVRLTNAYEKYCHRLNICISESSLEDYIFDYTQAWRSLKNTRLRLFYEDNDDDPLYRYDNISVLMNGFLYSPETFDYLSSSHEQYYPDPNDFPPNRSLTAKYESIYHFRSKERKINNFVMSQQNYQY